MVTAGGVKAALLYQTIVPVPLLVLLSVIVGLPVIFQHTPFETIDEPPSLSTFPPDIAVILEISVILKVVTVGNRTLSFLQACPAGIKRQNIITHDDFDL